MATLVVMRGEEEIARMPVSNVDLGIEPTGQPPIELFMAVKSGFKPVMPTIASPQAVIYQSEWVS